MRMTVDETTIKTYDAKAADYAKLVGTDMPSGDLSEFIADIPKGGHVLDLGCGPAAASAHMRAAGLVPDPMDASEGMVRIANETHDIGARIGTFDDVTGEAVYDGVWASFCLLHAPREALPRHLAAIHKSLRSGGQFFIGMKTGQGQDRDGIGRMYTFVSVLELNDLLNTAGFDVTSVREGREKGLAGTEDPFVVMRAVKRG